MTGGGGGGGGYDRGSYFIPKKIPTSEFVYLKKSHTSSKCAYAIVDLS